MLITQLRAQVPRTSTGLLVKEEEEGKAGGVVTGCVRGSSADLSGTRELSSLVRTLIYV